MKKFFFIILILFVPSLVLAVPVSYKGTIEYDAIDSINTLKAVSTTGTTEKQIVQSSLQTKFLLNHMANPDENVDFYFNGIIIRRYTQPKPATIVDLENIVVGIKDADGDNVADDDDNCVYITNPDQVDTNEDGIGDACADDLDGDGVDDEDDTLIGDESHIVTNLPSLDLEIGGDTDTNKQFTDEQPIKFTSGTDTIIEFDFDFSTEDLMMSDILIQTQEEDATYGGIIISGLDLTAQGKTKIAYLDRLTGEDYVCVKDVEIASITELPSTGCSGANEIPVLCPGSNLGYTCSIEGAKFKVSGLTHSGVGESTYTPPPTPTPPSPGGGGGGGCFHRWVCEDWSECLEEGIQTRTCDYTGSCGMPNTNPNELEQDCEYIAPEEVEEVEEEILPIEEEVTETTAAKITGAVIGTAQELGKTLWSQIIGGVIVLFVVIYLLYVIVFRSGAPLQLVKKTHGWYYNRASLLHRKADEFYKKGKRSKADRLFKKAQSYREKGEQKQR